MRIARMDGSGESEAGESRLDKPNQNPLILEIRVLDHWKTRIAGMDGSREGEAKEYRLDEANQNPLSLEIRVLDHLVVGDGEMVSFSERGLL